MKTNILLENSRDRKINKLIADNFNVTDFNEIRQIRARLLNRIPNARARNERWLYQILSYLIDGEIPRSQYKKFNEFLAWLNNNEAFDPNIEAADFNELPFRYVQQYYEATFYRDAINTAIEQGKITPKVNYINGFTIRRIDNADEALKLGKSIFKNEAWCIFRDEGLYEEMMGYESTCYVVTNDRTFGSAKSIEIEEISQMLKNMGENDLAENILIYDNGYCEGCESIETDEYFKLASLDNGLPPYDEYGMSALVVVTYPDGKIHEVWSRYNIPHCYDGFILTPEQLSSIIGADINELCPYVNDIGIKENFKHNKLFINKTMNNMKKTITLSEKDLHRLIAESVNEVLSEGFWGDMAGAYQGAKSGYGANKAANTVTATNNNSGRGQRNISQKLNQLYKMVGMLATDYPKYGQQEGTDFSGTVKGIKDIADWLYGIFCKNMYQ